MDLRSAAYLDTETMPDRFATTNVIGGAGISIPLEWRDAPSETRSFAIALIDTHPVARDWVHWLVTDLPVDTRSLTEGASMTSAMPVGAVEYSNTGGRRGYGGPQPPVGSGVHDYVTTVYALDIAHVAVGPEASWDDVLAAMSGHIIDSARLTGRFGR